MANRPAVIMSQSFVRPHKQASENYVDYMDRAEAKERKIGNKNEADLYIEYMDRDVATRIKHFKDYNSVSYVAVELVGGGKTTYIVESPRRSTDLFTAVKDNLTLEEKQKMKEKFRRATQNESVLWQTVFSFDNAFLLQQHLLDQKTGNVDEQLIMNATRESMAQLKRSEKLSDTLIWTGAIHYNTDNIHVHIGMMELEPSRPKIQVGDHWEYRGKMKQSSLDSAKSKFIHYFFDRSQRMAHLQQLMREKLTTNIFEGKVFENDLSITQEMLNVYGQLPKSRNLWQYKNKKLDDVRPQLNHLSWRIMQLYEWKSYKELIEFLDEEEKFYKEIYGEGTKDYERYKDYKKNKLEELEARFGNMLLRYMKDNIDFIAYQSSNNRPNGRSGHFGNIEFSFIDPKNYSSNTGNVPIENSLKGLAYALRGASQEFLSQLTYEREEARQQFERNKYNGRSF